jgi:4-carboxymuconolactone decarboxylase
MRTDHEDSARKIESTEEGRAVTEEYLPDVYLRMRSRFPTIADAFDALGEASENAGPLEERTQRLVKLGIAIGAAAEILHVAVLAITTRGFPAAVAAFSWIDEVLSAGL